MQYQRGLKWRCKPGSNSVISLKVQESQKNKGSYLATVAAKIFIFDSPYFLWDIQKKLEGLSSLDRATTDF